MKNSSLTLVLEKTWLICTQLLSQPHLLEELKWVSLMFWGVNGSKSLHQV